MAVAVASQTTTAFASANTLTLNRPANVANGDLLIAVVYGQGTAEVNSVPSGWNTLQVQPSPNTLELSVYYKVASSEPASWQWGFDATQQVAGGVLRVTGFNPSVNVETSAKANSGNDDTPTFANSITQSQADSLLILAIGAEQFANSSPSIGSYQIANSNPTWTEAFELRTTGGNDAMSVAYAIRNATGATGNSSCDVGDSNANTTDCSAIILAIPPRVDVTVSPAVLDLTASVQSPDITGGATFSVLPVDLTVTPQSVTVSEEVSDWTNQDKTEAPDWINAERS